MVSLNRAVPDSPYRARDSKERLSSTSGGTKAVRPSDRLEVKTSLPPHAANTGVATQLEVRRVFIARIDLADKMDRTLRFGEIIR